MTASAFTPRQRRVVLLMVLLVAVVLALLAGFITTALKGLEGMAIATPAPGLALDGSPSPTSLPTATPASTAIPERGIWSQVRGARLFDQIAHQVESQRELAPRSEVPLTFMDEGEMKTALSQVYAERNPETGWVPLALLDLLPGDPISIQPHPSAGVYVPEQEMLYVATDRAQRDSDAQWVLAHAYVHALQDQHFDLEAMTLRAETMDGRLAVQALVEGDAMLLTALYGYQELSSVDWGRLSNLITSAEVPGYDPARDQGGLKHGDLWTRVQRFPHDEGTAFVEALFEAGGWDAVNGAYVDPPRSAEQILHPSRYLGRHDGTAAVRDDPTIVVVPDLGLALGEDWTALVKETLGEFITRLFLSQTLPEARALETAEGWDGDTFVVWGREDGRRVFVWRSIWDSTVEAAQFEQGLEALVPQRYYPVRPVAAPRGLPGDWWETEEGAMQVYRAGRHVLYVRAPDVNTVANLAEVLP